MPIKPPSNKEMQSYLQKASQSGETDSKMEPKASQSFTKMASSKSRVSEKAPQSLSNPGNSHLNYLRIPLDMLYTSNEPIQNNGLEPKQIAAFHRQYSEQEAKNIIDSLHFANNNANFDFKSLCPGLSYSNEEIHKFLSGVYSSIVKK